ETTQKTHVCIPALDFSVHRLANLYPDASYPYSANVLSKVGPVLVKKVVFQRYLTWGQTVWTFLHRPYPFPPEFSLSEVLRKGYRLHPTRLEPEFLHQTLTPYTFPGQRYPTALPHSAAEYNLL